MSLAVIKAEISRFLSSEEPEVLCIKGKWGVGKTYGWRKYLREANESRSLSHSKYAYISLFGLNSLDDLRYALFANTTTGDNIGNAPDSQTFDDLLRNPDIARKLRPMAELVASFFNRKSVLDVLAKSAFLAVRNQLICLDDLERAGSGLGAREVLGLASLLKEERKCKVVLLLNDEQHDEREEFDRQLEKVSDVTLHFDPTPEEAAGIALDVDKTTADLLTPLIVNLQITNIRVIKRIEKLSLRLVKLLGAYNKEIVRESAATLVLASWSVQQPDIAPSLEFLRTYNRMTFALSRDQTPTDPKVERFRAILADYPFTSSNSLDQAIMDGAKAGYFVDSKIKLAADEVAAERKRQGPSAFTQVWQDLYHGSLTTDDDDFLDALHQSAIQEAENIALVNINGAIRLLRETGRSSQADDLISAYIEAHMTEPLEFFDITTHSFISLSELDGGLREAFAAKRQSYVDSRDPLEILRELGQRRTWGQRDLVLMSQQTVDDFERLFEALKGEEISRSIETITIMGAQNQAESNGIRIASAEALRRIAAKSPLRERKIRALGVNLSADPSDVST